MPGARRLQIVCLIASDRCMRSPPLEAWAGAPREPAASDKSHLFTDQTSCLFLQTDSLASPPSYPISARASAARSAAARRPPCRSGPHSSSASSANAPLLAWRPWTSRRCARLDPCCATDCDQSCGTGAVCQRRWVSARRAACEMATQAVDVLTTCCCEESRPLTRLSVCVHTPPRAVRSAQPCLAAAAAAAPPPADLLEHERQQQRAGQQQRRR